MKIRPLSAAALSLAVAAIVVSIATPLYTSYEKKKAQEKNTSVLVENQRQRSRPNEIGCVDGVVWITVHTSSFATAGAVWAENPTSMDSVVKCSEDGYMLEGEKMTKEEVLSLAVKTGLYDQLEPRQQKSNSSFPVVDMAYLAELQAEFENKEN